jgi:dihydroorotase
VTHFGLLTDPAASFVLEGVRIIDPDGSDRVADLAVVDGTLRDAGEGPDPRSRIDAAGLIATTGLCDLHDHLREPGAEGAETIASGTRAAARGGFTTVCAMPNTDPAPDTAAGVADLLARAGMAAARVRVVGAATRRREGTELAEISAMAEAGAVGFSDDGAAVPGACAEKLLAALAELGLPLFEHAEDPDLALGGLMRAGSVATRLGLAGWPAGAEVAVVERDLAIAKSTGARIHLTHLSAAASLAAVRRARADGVRVTCDVTPHHLALTDRWVAGQRAFAWDAGADAEVAPLAPHAYDTACRVNPPLPSREDALALLAGVEDGTVDAIATDHAPHPPERKEVEFSTAAPGMIGLETALSLGLAAVEAGHLSLRRLLAALSWTPAAIIGEERSLRPGSPADLVVFDPSATWRVEREALASKSANTPLLGMTLPGVVVLTVAAGRVTYAAERATAG